VTVDTCLLGLYYRDYLVMFIVWARSGTHDFSLWTQCRDL